MERITLSRTERSPEVDLDFEAGRFTFRGESYPEDAAAFFGPLLQAVRGFLAQGASPVTCEVELAYFNSSSAKALMNLFMLMEEAAAEGRPVTIRWMFLADDDVIQEAGEDFAADFAHARFELVEGVPA